MSALTAVAATLAATTTAPRPAKAAATLALDYGLFRGNPPLSFADDPNTGIYTPAADELAIMTGGSRRLSVDNAGVRIDYSATLGAVLGVTRGLPATPVVPTGEAVFATSHNHAIVGGSYASLYGLAAAERGSGGFHIGVKASAYNTPTGQWLPAGVHGMIGLLSDAKGFKPGSRIWGANIIANMFGPDGLDSSGVEIGLETNFPVGSRYGLSIITLPTSPGNRGAPNGAYGDDQAIRIADKAGNVNTKWKVGIAFGSTASGVVRSAAFPVRPDGVLIKSVQDGTVASAIDFSTLTISGYAFRSPGLNIAGNGWIGVGTDPLSPIHIVNETEAGAMRFRGASFVLPGFSPSGASTRALRVYYWNGSGYAVGMIPIY